jgi:outer membrane protein insertion porin family
MYKYIFLFLLLFSPNLFAEIVKKIEIKGNERISAETLKVYGELNLNKDYSTFDVNKVLKNLYNTEFFEDVKVSLKNGTLSISVKEYPTINSIDLRGEKSTKTKSKILEFLKLKEKESFIESKLANDISIIKKIYASQGFNFTTVSGKVEKFSNNRLNLVFFVEKGKKTNISSISFIGDKKIKEKRLRDIIVSEEKKFWKFLSRNTYLNYNNVELDKRLLLNYYKSLGYYDVQVLSNKAEISKENFTTLVYTINAGTRYKVNKISTNVSDVLDKKIFTPLEKSFSNAIGNYYSPFTVKKLLDDLDRLIANNDLQFIEHSVNEIIENDSIEIKINIYEGGKKMVERIDIKGNTVTNESVLRAELLLDEGDPFNVLKLNQSIARMKSRNLFSTVEKKVIDGANKNQKIIQISVEEKPTGEISAGAGIGTNGASFAFDVTENNWMGKGISVTTSLDVSAETFTGGLSVTDPNYNYSGNSLVYFVRNTTNDKPLSGFKNNVISTGIGTKFEQYEDFYISPTLTFNYDDLKVESSAGASLQKQKGTFSDLSLDYSIALDKRDKIYAPTSGYISTFNQALPVYADSPYLKNSYLLSKYKSFSEDYTGSFKFYSAAINGLSNKDVRLNKRIVLNSNRLRGFESGKVGPKDGNDYVGGNYAIASNFELSLPNLLPEFTKTDVGLFLDFANIWEVDYDSGVDNSNAIRSSTGVSTTWTSPIGPMSFVIAQNISKASTDKTETFNFKLGTTF